jgi:hypothetical protein
MNFCLLEAGSQYSLLEGEKNGCHEHFPNELILNVIIPNVIPYLDEIF